tara:strand:+ start:174 stop:728 length:555 start_codon:yes stop_codon:yes gene_type:complete
MKDQDELKWTEIKSDDKIPKNKYVVYSLVVDDKYIVLGHGKKNRAKVIFDNINIITYSHIKSFKVRLYHLFKPENEHTYVRNIIEYNNKEDAQKEEKILHNKHKGGNTNTLVEDFQKELYTTLNTLSLSKEEGDQVKLLLSISLNSSNSGLNDLKKWYKKKIINDKILEPLKEILKLKDLKEWK